MRILLTCLLGAAVVGPLMLMRAADRTADPNVPDWLAAVPSHKQPLASNEPLVPPIALWPGWDDRSRLAPGGEFPVWSLGTARGPAPNVQADTRRFDFSSDERAHFHPHGKQVCASGCALSNHPTPVLSRDEFLSLIAQCAVGPMNETNHALETLMYYGRQADVQLDGLGTNPLDAPRLEFLRRELSRSYASISLRLIDERGVIRAELPPTRVPLDRRHVFELDATDLPPLVASGTVKRVGLHHLWTRI